mmetsp:Transcript_12515/g.23377  ORF Transcript_12515/g.23377 Transcript_12515/m.23377 type:complete len:156 (-) Transcript_12515:66-533(-)
MIDTHLNGAIRCESIGLSTRQLSQTFESYANNAGMTKQQASTYIERSYDLLSSIVHAAHPILEAHEVNRGITESGASCWHHLRVDAGIAADFTPYIFEVNEFSSWARVHWTDKGRVAQLNSFRELINMIGLDKHPLPASERAAYEFKHKGNWTLL